MAANNYQKIAVLDIIPGTQQLIEAMLMAGYVIVSITSLTPTYNKLLIVYTSPPII